MVASVIALVAIVGIVLVARPSLSLRIRPLRSWLDECGFAGVSLGALALVMAVVALVVAGVVAAVVPIPVVTPIAAIAGLALPLAALDAARTRRRVAAESTWPEIIDTIRMALRAGAPLHESLAAALGHVPADWRPAWTDVVSDLARGASVGDALGALRRARAEPIADRVCETLIITADLGGADLPRVLEELARSVRDDLRARADATARQSWVRHAARLGSLAPWVVIVMLSGQAENRAAFASPAGAALIIGCAGATVVAYIVMTAMGRLPTPPRWVSDD